MPYQRIEVTRPKGVNSDLSSYELPNEVWSGANNVNFRKHRTNRGLGYSSIISQGSVQPLIAVPWTDYNLPYWFYASEDKIYRTNGTTHENVTRQSGGVDVDYTGTFDDGWTSSSFNGALLFNNATDAPQFYNATSSKMADLTAWPANWTCGVIRPFKNYLIALDIVNDVGEGFQSMVKWSDAAPVGGVPASWDPVDPAVQAGYNILPDTSGRCIEGKALNDTFFIYKTDAVWGMQLIGGNFVFSFRKIFSDDTGILGRDCVTEFDGKHFVVGVSDVYVHDGTTKKSVITNQIRDELYTQIHPDYVNKVKCVADVPNKEIWVYFPSQESTNGLCNRALVWNWEVQEWTKRDLVDISHIEAGFVVPAGAFAGDSWEEDTGSWQSDTTNWGEESLNPANKRLVLSEYTDRHFYEADIGTTIDGQPFTAYVERIGIDFGDDHSYKYINSVTPHLSGSGLINIYIGTENHQGEGVLWSAPQPFEIGVDYKVDFRKSGRYIAIKFESVSDEQWSLTGYTIELSPEGKR